MAIRHSIKSLRHEAPIVAATTAVQSFAPPAESYQQPDRSLKAVLFRLVETEPFDASTAPPGHILRFAARIIGLAMIAIVAYLPVFRDVPRDQTGEIKRYHTAVPEIRVGELLPWGRNIGWQLESPRSPLRIFMHLEDWVGTSITAHRLCGWALHVACAVLLWFVLRRLAMPAAWLAAAAFAAHPGGVAAVAQVDQHGRLWSTLWSLIAMLLLFRTFKISPLQMPEEEHKKPNPAWEYHAPNRMRRWRESLGVGIVYTLAIIATWIASLCQPTVTIAIGPIALLLIAWRRQAILREPWKVAALLAPFFLLAGSVLLAGGGAASSRVGSLEYPPAISWPITRVLWAMGWALRWITMPYPFEGPVGPGSRLLALATCAAGVVICAVLFLLLLRRNRIGSGPVIALACFLLLLPTLIATLAADRETDLTSTATTGWTYLAAIPLLVLAANEIAKLACRAPQLRQRMIQVISGSIVLLILGALAAARADLFSSPEDILRSAVATDPRSLPARARLAEYLLQKQENDAAEKTLGASRLSDCTDASFAIAEGDLLSAEEKPGAAVVWYERAAILDAGNVELPQRLASVDLVLGRNGDAISAYKRGLEMRPDDVELRNEYALFLAKNGELDASAEQFRAATAAEPDYVPVRVNLASVFAEQGKLAESAEEYQAVVRLDPENFDAFHNAGVLLVQLHSYETACTMLAVAAHLKPDSPEAHNDLGVALSSAGKYRHAIWEFQQAIALRSTYADAQRNLDISQRRAAVADATQPAQLDWDQSRPAPTPR